MKDDLRSIIQRGVRQLAELPADVNQSELVRILQNWLDTHIRNAKAPVVQSITREHDRVYVQAELECLDGGVFKSVLLADWFFTDE